jgi:hypothetical protein
VLAKACWARTIGRDAGAVARRPRGVCSSTRLPGANGSGPDRAPTLKSRAVVEFLLLAPLPYLHNPAYRQLGIGLPAEQ